jgi:CSLREA domain-containing protein
MFPFSWRKAYRRTCPDCSRPSRKPTSRPPYKPAVEVLEDRLAPAIITVTISADDNTPNDGTVSLREAIQAINNGTAGADTDIINQNPGTFSVNDTINFNISAAGTVQTINVGGTGNGALPALMKPMTINGYSEMGASMNTLANGDNAKILIELNGSNAGPNADGLLVTTGAPARPSMDWRSTASASTVSSCRAAAAPSRATSSAPTRRAPPPCRTRTTASASAIPTAAPSAALRRGPATSSRATRSTAFTSSERRVRPPPAT